MHTNDNAATPHHQASCELLLDVDYTQVVGQPLKHLANKVINGVMTHVVGLNNATRRWESWNMTVQHTCTPISTDSPCGDSVYVLIRFLSTDLSKLRVEPLVGL